jgi:hypothetical protein
MKTFLTATQCRTVLICAVGLATPVMPVLAGQETNSNWQIRFSANTMFNVSASFRGHPAAPLLSNSHDQSGAANYDNGYVGRDVSGDPNYSTYWGYNQSSQQILSGGNVVGLNYERTTPLANAGSPRLDADPSVGGDLNLRREITKWGEVRFGLELGASYNKVDIKDSSSYYTTGQRTAYSYGLAAPMDASLFPPAGYQGPFNGLGPIINPTPTTGQTAMVPNAVLVSGTREVEADIFGFRLGPYIEMPLSKRFSASISAGALVALVHDHVNWSENLAVNTATVSGYWTGSSSVSGDSCGVTAGFYAGADVSFQMSENWSLFAGARFQDAGTYTHHLGDGEMNLNQGQTFSLELGVGYSF